MPKNPRVQKKSADLGHFLKNRKKNFEEGFFSFDKKSTFQTLALRILQT
jgi:hypothetical protein